MQSTRESELSEQQALGQIARHIEAAMDIMDSIKAGTAFSARCQEVLDEMLAIFGPMDSQ